MPLSSMQYTKWSEAQGKISDFVQRDKQRVQEGKRKLTRAFIDDYSAFLDLVETLEEVIEGKYSKAHRAPPREGEMKFAKEKYEWLTRMDLGLQAEEEKVPNGMGATSAKIHDFEQEIGGLTTSCRAIRMYADHLEARHNDWPVTYKRSS